MKERFLTVSVLMVFVAFAVFPMTLEADPGIDENQYEIYKVDSEAFFIANTRFINITKYITLNNECKNSTTCDSLSFRVPKGQTLVTQSISIGAGLAVGLDPNYSPYASIVLTMPDPEGPGIVTHRIGILDFSVRLDSDEGQQAILSKDINLILGPGTTFFINVKTYPNRLHIMEKMYVTITGHFMPFDRG